MDSNSFKIEIKGIHNVVSRALLNWRRQIISNASCTGGLMWSAEIALEQRETLSAIEAELTERGIPFAPLKDEWALACLNKKGSD